MPRESQWGTLRLAACALKPCLRGGRACRLPRFLYPLAQQTISSYYSTRAPGFMDDAYIIGVGLKGWQLPSCCRATSALLRSSPTVTMRWNIITSGPNWP